MTRGFNPHKGRRKACPTVAPAGSCCRPPKLCPRPWLPMPHPTLLRLPRVPPPLPEPRQLPDQPQVTLSVRAQLFAKWLTARSSATLADRSSRQFSSPSRRSSPPELSSPISVVVRGPTVIGPTTATTASGQVALLRLLFGPGGRYDSYHPHSCDSYCP